MTLTPTPSALSATFNADATHGLTTDEARYLLDAEWATIRDEYLTELDSKRAANKSRVAAIAGS